MKTVRSAESDAQKTSRMTKEGRRRRQKTGSDAQPTSSQKQEERTNRDAAETRDQSVIASVVRINRLIGFIVTFLLCNAVRRLWLFLPISLRRAYQYLFKCKR